MLCAACGGFPAAHVMGAGNPCRRGCGHCDLQPDHALDRPEHPRGPDGRGAYPLHRAAAGGAGPARRPDAARAHRRAAMAGRAGAGRPQERPRRRQADYRPAARARPAPMAEAGAGLRGAGDARPGVVDRGHPPGGTGRGQPACAPGRARPRSREREAGRPAVREGRVRAVAGAVGRALQRRARGGRGSRPHRQAQPCRQRHQEASNPPQGAGEACQAVRRPDRPLARAAAPCARRGGGWPPRTLPCVRRHPCAPTRG